ncbi:MAG TPA: endonuclease/exonuclease/phosphatase family protein [Nocardioides sp.]|nr:endonuclease/exonuclease/phosphatase family protein [Nocardioides sp.]
MPDDQGPRLELPRRAVWAAPATVLVLVGALAVGVRVLGASGDQPVNRSAPVVTTAPTSSATVRPGRELGKHHHHVGPALRPVKVHRDPSCPIVPPHILRVLQLNIHAGIGRTGAVDLPQIAAEIRAADPDVVSLNEVDSGTARSGGTDEASYLGRATGLHAVYGPNLRRYDGGRFGNAILSRYPVVASHNLRLPRAFRSEPRGLLSATLRIGGRTVTFSSLHLSQGHRGLPNRIRQAEAVAGVLRDASDPTIVAGDLNSRPADLPVRILRQYLLDAQDQGGTGAGNTVPETAPRSRFDYVLYDNHFAPVAGSTQVLPSSSDHRGVLTELVLRPRGQC